MSCPETREIDGDLHGVEFKEQTGTLGPPKGMTEEEVKTLPVYRDGDRVISVWTTSIWCRLYFLFTGKLYLHVMGKTMPPIGVGVATPFKETVEICKADNPEGEEVPVGVIYWNSLTLMEEEVGITKHRKTRPRKATIFERLAYWLLPHRKA